MPQEPLSKQAIWVRQYLPDRSASFEGYRCLFCKVKLSRQQLIYCTECRHLGSLQLALSLIALRESKAALTLRCKRGKVGGRLCCCPLGVFQRRLPATYDQIVVPCRTRPQVSGIHVNKFVFFFLFQLRLWITLLRQPLPVLHYERRVSSMTP